MALRSVVLESPGAPPAPRKTVVLRTGGPAPKGRFADVGAGVVGVLLLVAALVLVQVLPVHEYANPRFRLAFPDTTPDLAGGSQVDYFPVGTSKSYDIPIADDNVVLLTIKVGVKDDMPASHPDTFRVTLFDLNGQQVGQPLVLSSPEPHQSDPVNNKWSSDFIEGTLSLALHEHPQEQIVQGKARYESVAQAQARLAPQYLLHTKGTWKLKVEMLSAGGCPDPSKDPTPGTPQQGALEAQQGSACLQGSLDPNGPSKGNPTTTDAGNDFTLENVLPTFYTPTVTELK